ncbi:MAG: thiamine phosphate synthase, partial [Hyphomonadaceae bacterium]
GASAVLAALARRLNQAAGAPALPALYFFTDPARTPDPAAVAARLPPGTALVYRAFGAPQALETALALAQLARRRGLLLLIGADAGLAQRVGAHGVHLPERAAAAARALKARHPNWLVTAAAHSARALRRAGPDAFVLAPILPSRSPSARRSLGLLRAQRLARLACAPVIALGGVNARTARRLAGRGFAGLACVEGLAGV